MKYYMAPMEGLTGYIYRNAYQKYFHDIDRYFTPFITNKKLDFKVKKDIDPDFLRYRISWTVFWIKFLMHVTAKSPSKPESEKIRRTSGRISLRFMRNIRYQS